MLYYKDTKLRRRGEVYIGGRGVIYTRFNAKSLAKPLTRLTVQIIRYSAVILPPPLKESLPLGFIKNKVELEKRRRKYVRIKYIRRP